MAKRDELWGAIAGLRPDDRDPAALLPRRAIDVLGRIWTTGHAEGPPTEAHGEMSRRGIAHLARIVQLVAPRKTLEVGFAKGTSTLAILTAVDAQTPAQHTAVDPLQTATYRRNGVSNVAFVGAEDRLRLMEAGSALALPFLMQAEAGSFDFVFIDATHRFDDTMVEWFYADKLIAQNGFIVFDDANAPAVRAVVNFVASNLNYRVHIDQRIAIAQRIGRDSRNWFDFTPFDTPDGAAYAARIRDRIAARAERSGG